MGRQYAAATVKPFKYQDILEFESAPDIPWRKLTGMSHTSFVRGIHLQCKSVCFIMVNTYQLIQPIAGHHGICGVGRSWCVELFSVEVECSKTYDSRHFYFDSS